MNMIIFQCFWRMCNHSSFYLSFVLFKQEIQINSHLVYFNRKCPSQVLFIKQNTCRIIPLFAAVTSCYRPDFWYAMEQLNLGGKMIGLCITHNPSMIASLLPTVERNSKHVLISNLQDGICTHPLIGFSKH